MIGNQAGVLVVIHDNFRARRETRLHMRLNCQSAFDSLLCKQSGRKHHRGIRCIRATRDGGDDDRSILHLGGFAVHIDGRFARLFTQACEEVLLHVFQIDAVLRALRTGEGRRNFRQIQFERVGSTPGRRISESGTYPAPSRTPRPTRSDPAAGS